MDRRLFLQFPLLASVLALQAKNHSNINSSGGFVVRAGKDRYQDELNIMGGQFDCKVSSKDTDGALLIYDTVREAKGGPALHFHHTQDELFYIIKGEFIVQVGDETFNLQAGDFAFAPRKIPHTFAKTNDGEGQMLVMFQPAGSMEDFFKEMSKLGQNIPKDMEHALKDLFSAHGMQVVGPPLKY
ncbi:MAG TPA: cupin domain-containing protein [Mucilaginibacter sp.]|nr:cupin domain-containing protein [Mucilaginibacter sp.]